MKEITKEKFLSSCNRNGLIEIVKKIDNQVKEGSLNFITITSPNHVRTSHTFGYGSTGYTSSTSQFLFSEKFSLVFNEEPPNAIQIHQLGITDNFYSLKLTGQNIFAYKGSYDRGLGMYTKPEFSLGKFEIGLYEKQKIEIITDIKEINSFLNNKFEASPYKNKQSFQKICNKLQEEREKSREEMEKRNQKPRIRMIKNKSTS